MPNGTCGEHIQQAHRERDEESHNPVNVVKSGKSNYRKRPKPHAINPRTEVIPEGVYLATSEDALGLIFQGRGMRETLEIAGDATFVWRRQ